MRSEIKEYLKNTSYPKYLIFDHDYKCVGGRVDLLVLEEGSFVFINFLEKSIEEETEALRNGAEEYVKLKTVPGNIRFAFIVKDSDGLRRINEPFFSNLSVRDNL